MEDRGRRTHTGMVSLRATVPDPQAGPEGWLSTGADRGVPGDVRSGLGRDMTKPTFTARTPVDLIALAPVVLGFHPQDSIVLLTFGANHGRQFHARVELPVDPDDIAAVVQVLVRPIERHGITDAAVLIYSDDVEVVHRAAVELVPAIDEAGCRVIDALRVDDDCYQPALDTDAAPVPYDISNHEFTVQSVYLGRQALPSRADIADQLVGGSETEIEEVRAAAEQARAEGIPAPGKDAAQRRWIRAFIDSWLASRELASTEESGVLVHLLETVELRDVAWERINQDNCEQMIELWVQLLRRCPEEFLPAPAALLGFSAWLAGHGALAWCAVDRCLGEDPDYSLGHLLSKLLTEAVPPQAWTTRGVGRSA
ncbi:MAG: DUF4192 domain-containing protein [Myxococcales bacterium]|nr:MAG: DUF4192 domain-containing protein [Myxococcales bacterium]